MRLCVMLAALLVVGCVDPGPPPMGMAVIPDLIVAEHTVTTGAADGGVSLALGALTLWLPYGIAREGTRLTVRLIADPSPKAPEGIDQFGLGFAAPLFDHRLALELAPPSLQLAAPWPVRLVWASNWGPEPLILYAPLDASVWTQVGVLQPVSGEDAGTLSVDQPGRWTLGRTITEESP